MNVLMITGDKNVMREGTPAHERFLLQKAQVQELKVVYWGRGALTSAFSQTGAFDVVTVQDPFIRGVVGWLVARKLGSKLNVQVHTDLRAQSFIKKAIAAFVLRRADSVRAVSRTIANSLSYLGSPVCVLPIYIDIEAVRTAAPSSLLSKYPQFEHMVLVSSRLEPEKNVAAAIRTMKEVLVQLPLTGLFIAGGGSQKEYLERLAKELGILKSVVFLGHRSDIFSLYKEASVLFVTSHYEGYGASIVEALAAGTPVVAPDTGIAREAGAHIVEFGDYSETLIDILRSHPLATLKLEIVGRDAWAAAWKETLL